MSGCCGSEPPNDAHPLLEDGNAKFGKAKDGKLPVRYVRLESKQQYIHVQQVEVYDSGGYNLALKTAGAVATQSSEGFDGDASNPIDGIKDEDQPWPNSNHTLNKDDPEWWEVDLGKEIQCTRVVIYNRPDQLGTLFGCTLTFLNDSRQETFPPQTLDQSRVREIMFEEPDLSWVKSNAWACTISRIARADYGLPVGCDSWVKVLSVDGNKAHCYNYKHKRETDIETSVLRKVAMEDWKRYASSEWAGWAGAFGIVGFIVGYYADLIMEFSSAWNFFQSSETQNLSFALIFLSFVSPVTCWLMLYSNSLENIASMPLFLMHVTPIIKMRSSLMQWFQWRKLVAEAVISATKAPNNAPRQEVVFTWMPVCKSVFACSLTLLFKIYGVFVQSRTSILRNTDAPELLGVFCSLCFSMVSVSHSIVALSHYGKQLGIVFKMFSVGVRFVEVSSRVVSVGLFGLVFADKHSITAVLSFDLILQLMLLLLHPSSRQLMRREMSFPMLLFWAAMMVLAAPPSFIPQLGDMHSAYYFLRMLELTGLIAMMYLRCGLPGADPSKIIGPPELVAGCELTDPYSDMLSTWTRRLLMVGYAASAMLPLLFFAACIKWLLQVLQARRLAAYREEQVRLAGDHFGTLTYDEILYFRVSSLPNRFLLSAVGAEKQFEAVEAPCCTQKHLDGPSNRASAGWSFVDAAGTTHRDKSDELVRHVYFGDLVRIKSAAHEDRFLSGGRRGCNMFAGTHDYFSDLKSFPLDYDLGEHYKWRVVAVRPKFGPDDSYRIGEPVDVLGRFSLQACPTLYPTDELYLTAGRGSESQKKRKEVWTVSFHSRAAFEDAPNDGVWPSFEFFAQRTPTIDSSDIVNTIEQTHQDLLDRGAALAEAGKQEDIMMQTFMMQSGVPLTVSDDMYFTPLHHFILQYAREGDKQVRQAAKNGFKGPLVVEHQVPVSVFEMMLHSGLPHLELGAKMLYSPLHFAALLGERKLCDLLLQANADINVGDSEGWTPLHDACLYGHTDTLVYLLNQPDIKVNASSRSGLRPIDVADPDAKGWLVAKGAKGGEDNAADVPPVLEGDKFMTNFVDPREDPELMNEKCPIDNQAIGGKFLAVFNLGGSGKPCCFYCVRAFWKHGEVNADALMPAFRCPQCHDISRVPYFDSLWAVCWCCQQCSARSGQDQFPNKERIEAGRFDTGGHRAQTMFDELDTDKSGTLSLTEFCIFFEKLYGKYDATRCPDHDEETNENGTAFKSDYAREVFRSIDKDHNGSLSLAEFTLAFSSQASIQAGTLVKVTGGLVQVNLEDGPILILGEDDLVVIEQEEGEGSTANTATADKFHSGHCSRRPQTRTTFTGIPCVESLLRLR